MWSLVMHQEFLAVIHSLPQFAPVQQIEKAQQELQINDHTLKRVHLDDELRYMNTPQKLAEECSIHILEQLILHHFTDLLGYQLPHAHFKKPYSKILHENT
jgi:hypothetical protein